MNNSKDQIDVSGITQFLFTGLKWLSMFGFIVSIVGLVLSVHGSYPLWINSTHSTGTIIGYNAVHLSQSSMSNSSSNSFETQFPIVSFTDLNGNEVEFEGKFGHDLDQKGEVVPILFSSKNSKTAIIDLGSFHNWLSTYIWLFCMIASLLGIKRFSQKPNL